MTSCLTLACDDERLNVVDIHPEKLATVLLTGGTVVWVMKGMSQVIPLPVLRNAVAERADQAWLLKRGRITHMPPSAGEIRWSQTVSPPAGS